jgi:tetratricopeptide (TPR) repeat protein
MRAIILSICIFVSLNNLITAGENPQNRAQANREFVNIINELKKSLNEIIIMSNTSERDKLLISVQKGEELINKTLELKKKYKELIEFELFARQVLAGIYFHRLSLSLKAITHYALISENDYFKENAPPLVKWLIFEGLGLSYYLQKNFAKSLPAFLKSFDYAINLAVKSPERGGECIIISAFNIATVYAINDDRENAVKYLTIAHNKCRNDQEKENLKNMIKKETVFSNLYDISAFRTIIR